VIRDGGLVRKTGSLVHGPTTPLTSGARIYTFEFCPIRRADGSDSGLFIVHVRSALCIQARGRCMRAVSLCPHAVRSARVQMPRACKPSQLRAYMPRPHACNLECLRGVARVCVQSGVRACNAGYLRAVRTACVQSMLHRGSSRCIHAIGDCMRAIFRARVQCRLRTCHLACLHTVSSACMHVDVFAK
jgi:hypothetical protein